LWKGKYMRVSLISSQLNNSQPLRFCGHGNNKTSFKNTQNTSHNKNIDYKKEYEKSQAQLEYMNRKYAVLCNICALSMNPNFKI